MLSWLVGMKNSEDDRSRHNKLRHVLLDLLLKALKTIQYLSSDSGYQNALPAKAAGTIDPDQIAETMRKLPVNFFGRPGGMASMDAEIRHTRYIMSRLLLDCLRLIDEVRTSPAL